MSSYLSKSIQPVIGTIVAGGAGTAIGTYFQDRTNEIAERRSRKDEHMAKANQICEKLFENLDKTLYLNKEAMYVGVNHSQKDDLKLGDASVWRRYMEALEHWKAGEQRSIAETEIYFGDDLAKEVEELHHLFNRYESIVWNTYHAQETSNNRRVVNKRGDPNDFRTKYFDGERQGETCARRREIDIKLREVARDMVALLKEGKLGNDDDE